MTAISQRIIDFIQQSPTPFHAVELMKTRLLAANFIELKESDRWEMQAGGRYFVTRNGSSIIAFVHGSADLNSQGIRMVGGHTDSPNLKVKPNPDIHQKSYWQLGVEVYGGVLLNPWFDRPLALAGRVGLELDDGSIQTVLVDSKSAVGCIPSLAIHLDRSANEKRSINPQTDLPVLMAQDEDKKLNFKAYLQSLLKAQQPALKVAKILDYEMSFYEAEAGQCYGLNQEFIAASRLDNLLSCFIGLEAMLDACQQGDTKQSLLLVCNDHEEVGSQSSSGAAGSMLEQFLKRLSVSEENYGRIIDKSMMISADNAHAVHPNFSAKHDNNHGPLINAGPVIKINANQRYASNAYTQSVFRQCCEKAGVPVQSFVVRSDMGCGSTIGPITSANIGVKTVDIGVPTFSMHSIRETAGSEDSQYLIDALGQYFQMAF